MRQTPRRPVLQISVLALVGAAALAALADEPAGDGHAGHGQAGLVRSELRDGIITVEAEDASVADIIEDISRIAGFEVRGDSPAKDVRMTRTLKGTLDELLIGLLRDGSYVLATEAGAPKRLTILSAGAVRQQALRTEPLPSAADEQQLREREGELVQQIAQYEDMQAEARERSKPEFAMKIERYIKKLSREAESIRARLHR